MEERGGKPAKVRGTERGDDTGILRIDLPGGAGDESLEEFPGTSGSGQFEDRNLAFLYQDEKASGEGNTFFKLVRRDGESSDAS